MTAMKHTDSHEVEHGPNRLSCKVSHFYDSTSPSCLSPVTWEQLLTQTHEQLATPSKLERDTSISAYSVRVNDNMRYDKEVETKHTSILAFLPITLFHVPRHRCTGSSTAWSCNAATHREGVGLLPADGGPPRGLPCRLRERLGHHHHDEQEDECGDDGCHDNDLGRSILVTTYPCTQGWTENQTGRKCGSDLAKME